MSQTKFFPPELSDELFIDDHEVHERTNYLIELGASSGIYDAADYSSLKRQDFAALAVAGLVVDKSRAKLIDINTRSSQIHEQLDNIDQKLKSEKSYLARGAKPGYFEQTLILGMALFPGLSLGKMILLFVPIPVLAIPLGIMFGMSFFLLSEQLILQAWTNAVIAPQLSTDGTRQATNRAIWLSLLFVLVDACITGLSMILSSIPEGGSIENLSWLWLVFSILTSIVMVFILHNCATRNKYRIRRVLNEYRRNDGVALEEISAWLRAVNVEKKKLKREKKELKRKLKVLTPHISHWEGVRANYNAKLQDVEHLQRNGLPRPERPEKPPFSTSNSSWQDSLSGGYVSTNEDSDYWWNGEVNTSKVETNSHSGGNDHADDNLDAKLF